MAQSKAIQVIYPNRTSSNLKDSTAKTAKSSRTKVEIYKATAVSSSYLEVSLLLAKTR